MRILHTLQNEKKMNRDDLERINSSAWYIYTPAQFSLCKMAPQNQKRKWH